MTTVAIVGAGDIGGATARSLAAHDRVGRVLLIDSKADAAAGKALDIQQSGAVEGFHTRLEGTSDETRVIGCSVCVIADRMGVIPGEWQGDEGLAMLARLDRYLAGAPVVFAGPDQTDLLAGAANELRVKRERLIGSSPEAFASSLKAIVALEARCSPRDVTLAVFGRPPKGLVVPWAEASIGGRALPGVLSQAQIARIDARASRLWPPGPNTLGVAAAAVAEAILGASRRSFGVLTGLQGEFGIRRGTGILPVRLGAEGIVDAQVPNLGSREQVQVQTALNA
jgi:malate dehydrogenase